MPNFVYDGHRAPRPTGIRKAIRDNYREVGRIKPVQGEERFLLVSYEPVMWQGTRYGFEEITVLVPKTVPAPTERGRPSTNKSKGNDFFRNAVHLSESPMERPEASMNSDCRDDWLQQVVDSIRGQREPTSASS